MSASPKLPPGLKFAQDFVTPDEERQLIALIEAEGIAQIDYDPGNTRCERTFGWLYDYPNRRIYPGEPLPRAILPLRARAAAFAGVEPESLVQCLLLRYDPGAHIQPHCDMPEWGVVLGLSLGALVTMEFVKPAASGAEIMPVELAPRSIYLQTGDARHVWQHSIPQVRETRWGITFRDLSEAGKKQRGETLRSSRS